MCEKHSVALKNLPDETAKSLSSRLSDLRSAETLMEIPEVLFLLTSEEDQKWLILDDSHILILESGHIPKKHSVCWEKVYRIKVVEIRKQHG